MTSSDPGSDSDVPESLSLTQTKKSAQSQNKAWKQAHADEIRRKKEKNRTRDRELKERAELRKRAKAEDDVVSRMERAMGDAGDEDSEEEDEDDLEITTEGAHKDEEGSEEYSEEGDVDEDDDMDSEVQTKHQEDDSMSDKSSEEEDFTSSNQNQNHLPEHLFASMSTPTPKQSMVSAPRKTQVHRKDTKKRSPHRTKPKDFVLGCVFLLLHIKSRSSPSVSRSRTIRSLSSGTSRPAPQHPVSNVAPPSRAGKFVNRSLGLNLKNTNGKNKKQWQRRPGKDKLLWLTDVTNETNLK